MNKQIKLNKYIAMKHHVHKCIVCHFMCSVVCWVLTVHISLVFILNKSVSSRFPRLETMNQHNLKEKALLMKV